MHQNTSDKLLEPNI